MSVNSVFSRVLQGFAVGKRVKVEASRVVGFGV